MINSSSAQYDVVIVGGGLGGLLTAVMLAKEGMSVCLLERDKQIGGCLQTYAVRKTIFDSCVHYIGGLGEGHTLWHIFKYAGIMDKLSLKPLDPNGFDRIAFAGEEISYPHAIGNENFIEQLLPYFPKEKSSLQQYIKTVEDIGDRFPLYRLRNGSIAEKTAVSSMEITHTLQHITGNKLLQQVLAGNNMLYAGVAGQTPFHMHAVVAASYVHSAHKVLPGSSQIAKLLGQELHKHGGVIRRNTEITKLHEENGSLTYAEAYSGERFYGKYFISNIAPKNLLSLTDSSLLRPIYRNRVNNLPQTISAYTLNLVLKPATVAHQNYNTYWHTSHDVWQSINYKPADWPQSYALYFTEDSNDPGYAKSLSILCYMHYDEVKQWANTYNRAGDEHNRGADYEQFKQQKAEILLNKVYTRLPALKGNILAQSISTPLTYRDYTATPEGSLYGILKDINHPNETNIGTRTRIPNLLLTGQNSNLHGVLGVSITAVATAAELLGLDDLLNKIKSIY
ncbi:MAG: phytoene desaturase family protein [Flavipsychrobacter sp.]